MTLLNIPQDLLVEPLVGTVSLTALAFAVGG